MSLEVMEMPDNLAITRQAMNTPAQRMLDVVGRKMLECPQIECPLKHEFTPGLYIRTIWMPATKEGTLVLSKIHKTEHPYFISKGSASVWIEGQGWKLLRAPFRGITKPGTRRILFIHEDCVWTTIHATNKTNVDEIERDVIFDPDQDVAVEMKGT